MRRVMRVMLAGVAAALVGVGAVPAQAAQAAPVTGPVAMTGSVEVPAAFAGVTPDGPSTVDVPVSWAVPASRAGCRVRLAALPADGSPVHVLWTSTQSAPSGSAVVPVRVGSLPVGGFELRLGPTCDASMFVSAVSVLPWRVSWRGGQVWGEGGPSLRVVGVDVAAAAGSPVALRVSSPAPAGSAGPGAAVAPAGGVDVHLAVPVAVPALSSPLTVTSPPVTATLSVAGADVWSWPVTVHRRWTPLRDDGPGAAAAYPRCSVLTWSYDPAAAPAGVGDVAGDVARAAASVAAATGLSFVQVPSGGTVSVGWGDVGPVLATGGSSWSPVSGFVAGRVTLSTGRQGPRRTADRVRLLRHELGHVVGLGHVDDMVSLMTPVVYVGWTAESFTRAELAGLEWLYRPSSCPGWRCAGPGRAW